jgi:hypothetical protein
VYIKQRKGGRCTSKVDYAFTDGCGCRVFSMVLDLVVIYVEIIKIIKEYIQIYLKKKEKENLNKK